MASVFDRIDSALHSIDQSRKRQRIDSAPTSPHSLLSPSMNQSELHARLITFTPITWSPFRPISIAAIPCTSHGWSVTSRDILTCSICHSTLKYPTVPFEHRESCASLFTQQLVTAHAGDCCWRKTSCPPSLLCHAPPLGSIGVRAETEAYELRAKRLGLIEGSAEVEGKQGLISLLSSLTLSQGRPELHNHNSTNPTDLSSILLALSASEIMALLHWDVELVDSCDKQHDELSSLLSSSIMSPHLKASRGSLALVCSCCQSRVPVSSFRRDPHAVIIALPPPTPGRMTSPSHQPEVTIAGGLVHQPTSSRVGMRAFGGNQGVFDRSTLPVPLPIPLPLPLPRSASHDRPRLMQAASGGLGLMQAASGAMEQGSSSEVTLKAFNPLLQHTTWCPWIYHHFSHPYFSDSLSSSRWVVPTASGEVGGGVDIDPKKLPGWIWLMSVIAGQGSSGGLDGGDEKRARELDERLSRAIGGLRQTKVKF